MSARLRQTSVDLGNESAQIERDISQTNTRLEEMRARLADTVSAKAAVDKQVELLPKEESPAPAPEKAAPPKPVTARVG